MKKPFFQSLIQKTHLGSFKNHFNSHQQIEANEVSKQIKR